MIINTMLTCLSEGCGSLWFGKCLGYKLNSPVCFHFHITEFPEGLCPCLDPALLGAAASSSQVCFNHLGEEHCLEGEGHPKTSAQRPGPARCQLAASVHGFSLRKENVAFSTTTEENEYISLGYPDPN